MGRPTNSVVALAGVASAAGPELAVMGEGAGHAGTASKKCIGDRVGWMAARRKPALPSRARHWEGVRSPALRDGTPDSGGGRG